MRAALYVRQSNKYDDEALSLQVQEDEMRAYAAENSLSVDARFVYVERHTGVDLFERPVLMRLLDDMQQGMFDELLLWKTNRFSREPEHLTYLMVLAKHRGVKLTFIREPLDDSDEGWLIRQVLGFGAKREWTNIRDATAGGRKKRVEHDRPLFGGRALYGYRVSDDRSRYEVDETTAPVVRRIFRDVCRGASLRSVAGRLNDDRVPTARGEGIWLPARIAAILKNPAYRGAAEGWRYQSERQRGGRRKTQLRPVDERIPLSAAAVPPLVEDHEWLEAQRRLERNRREAARHNGDVTETLLRAGFVVCGVCNSKMSVAHVDSHGRRLALYSCRKADRVRDVCTRHSIVARTLDREVWDGLVERLDDPAFIEQEIRRLAGQRTYAGEIENLDRAIDGLDEQIASISLALGTVKHDTARAALAVRIDDLAVQAEALRGERTALAQRDAEHEQALAWLADVREKLPELRLRNPHFLSYDRKRDVLTMFDARVKVWPAGRGPLGDDGQPLRWRVEGDLGPFIVSSTTTCSLHNGSLPLTFSNQDRRIPSI